LRVVNQTDQAGAALQFLLWPLPEIMYACAGVEFCNILIL
jgi:hypothetical protein